MNNNTLAKWLLGFVLAMVALFFIVEANAQTIPKRDGFRGRKDAPAHCPIPDEEWTDWRFDSIEPQFQTLNGTRSFISTGSSVVINGSFPGLENQLFFNSQSVTSNQGVTVSVDIDCYPKLTRLQYLSKSVIVFEYPRDLTAESGLTNIVVHLAGIGAVKVYRDIPTVRFSPSFNMPSGNVFAQNAANGVVFFYAASSGVVQGVDAVVENRPVFFSANDEQNGLIRYTINGAYLGDTQFPKIKCRFDDIPANCAIDDVSSLMPVGVRSLFVNVPTELRKTGTVNFTFSVNGVNAVNPAVVKLN
jgi:hypothetical protein